MPSGEYIYLRDKETIPSEIENEFNCVINHKQIIKNEVEEFYFVSKFEISSMKIHSYYYFTVAILLYIRI